MTVSWQYGFFVFILSQSLQFTPFLSGEDVHVSINFLINPYCSLQSFFSYQIAGFYKDFIPYLVMSQCGIDINKNNYKEVKECANDA